VERPLFQKADAIHCTSRQELRDIEDLKLRARTFVVPQPIDDSLLNIRPDFDMLQQLCPGLNDNPMVLYLGRISWIKRLPVLAEAFIAIAKDFPTSHLVVAGPWEDKAIAEDIQCKARLADIAGRVHLPGMVRGGVKTALLRRAEVFVQPSSHENFGISVAEALLFGKACVVGTGVALSDEIVAHKAGSNFVGGAENLSEAVGNLLRNPQLRCVCEKNAEELSANFRRDVVAKQLRQEYERCLKST
jgi:glycosyltransferase involved in cell wall biosynthesis